MRWAHENDYNSLIVAAATAHGLDPDLVKGIIGQESGFDHTAIAFDGLSVGLMQVTPGAAAEVGIAGDQTDPQTSIAAGTAYLALKIAQAGSYDAGISAYNGGYRPAKGYGAPLPSGSFANQHYVDHVKANWAYFRSLHPVITGTGIADETSTSPISAGGIIGIAILVVGALVAWVVTR